MTERRRRDARPFMSYVMRVRASTWLGAFFIAIAAAPAWAQDAPAAEGDPPPRAAPRQTPSEAGAPPPADPPAKATPRAEDTPADTPAPDTHAPDTAAPTPRAPDTAPAPSPDGAPPPAPTVTVEPVPAPKPDRATDDDIDLRILFGGIAVGVGGAAVVAGSVVAIIAAAKYADLECPDDSCPPELHEDARAYNDLRIPSGVTILAGSVLAFTGAVFLINGINDDDKFVAVEIGPQSVGLRGRF